MRSICAGKNTAQTDEEKQRERQRNEREQKNAEVEAQHLKVRIDLFEISCFFLNYTYIYVFCRSGVNSKKKTSLHIRWSFFFLNQPQSSVSCNVLYQRFNS